MNSNFRYSGPSLVGGEETPESKDKSDETSFRPPLNLPTRPPFNSQYSSEDNGRRNVRDRLGTRRPFRISLEGRNSYKDKPIYGTNANNNNNKIKNKRFSDVPEGPSKYPRNDYHKRRNRFTENLPKTSVQERLNKYKNTTDESTPTAPVNEEIESKEETIVVADDEDAPDITVEVINEAAHPDESSTPARFCLKIDPMIQNSIKKIQNRRKEQQVIYPFPVTPHSTTISMHDRFSFLN